MAAGHGCMHKNIFKYIDGDGIFSARWGWDVASWQQQAAVSKRAMQRQQRHQARDSVRVTPCVKMIITKSRFKVPVS